MTSLPKYVREDVVRALNHAANLEGKPTPSDVSWFEKMALVVSPGEPKKKQEHVKKTNLPKTVRARRPKVVKMSNTQIFAHNHERAKGFCECGCGLPFDTTFLGRETMDHYDNGRGKDERATTDNCWNLRWGCHLKRQGLSPSTAEWNRKFRDHCKRNGITKIFQHIEHAPLERATT